jgi:hypothetical protein
MEGRPGGMLEALPSRPASRSENGKSRFTVVREAAYAREYGGRDNSNGVGPLAAHSGFEPGGSRGWVWKR